MAKKATKRREWTADHVRTLKTLAREKKHASSIAKTLSEPRAQPGKRRLNGFVPRLEGLRVCTDQEVFWSHKAPPPCGAFY